MACPICTERLKDELGAGRCGHVFHHHCLSQWIELKESCPQCRAPCKKKKILKLFMPEGNLADGNLSELSPEQLRSELETCRGLIETQDKSLALTKQNLKKLKEEEGAWNCQYEALHKRYKIKEANCSCLTTQLKRLQDERDAVAKTLEETRAKVDQFSSYKRMKDVLDDSSEDVAELLKDSAYTRKELVRCLLNLKTKGSQARRSKEELNDQLTAMEAKVDSTREHLVQSVAECQQLRQQSSSLSGQVEDLRRKVTLLERAVESPASKRALCRMLESPMPGPSRKKHRLMDSEEEEEENRDTVVLLDSPQPSKYSHLQEKAAEVGIDLSVPVTSNSERIKRHTSYTKPVLGEVPVNVIPKARMAQNSQKLRFGYNGLGGKSSFLTPSTHKTKSSSMNNHKLRFVPRKK